MSSESSLSPIPSDRSDSESEGGNGNGNDSGNDTGSETAPDKDIATDPIRAKELAITALRASWEFAATTQFCTMFQAAVKFPFESTEAFENALVTYPPPSELIDLHVKMLRIMTFNRFVTPESWPQWFRKECEKKFEDWGPLFPEEKEYGDLTAIEKIRILRRISEWQFDLPERFRGVAKDDDDCRHWRVDPIGWDSFGGTYWLFDDNRLYREFSPENLPAEPPKARGRGKPVMSPEKHARLLKKKPKWELVCRTIGDWKTYPDIFKDVNHRYEKNLYQALTSGVGAKVIENLEEKEDQELKRVQLLEEHRRQEELSQQLLAQNMFRKRSSRLETKQLDVLEQERLDMVARGISADIQDFEFGRRATRSRVAAGPSIPLNPAQARQERLKRRKRDESESPIPEELLRESLESAHVDIMADDDEENSEVSGAVVDSLPPLSLTLDDLPPVKRRMLPVKLKSARGGGRGKKATATAADSWMFSCSCGRKAKNWDDGLPMISCGRCNVWQHIYCIELQAGTENPGPEVVSKWDNQEFICVSCRQQHGLAEVSKPTVSGEGMSGEIVENFNEQPLTPATSANPTSEDKNPQAELHTHVPPSIKPTKSTVELGHVLLALQQSSPSNAHSSNGAN
ncbi:UNVERIFIED_CONTAM: hypothetical protein HDU68_012478 [Siphonaria sp. JEL0065]|nr:hypothetical protein HDU68_012478 [Siphonaria sp. JEL0065]